jgi:hypothetical protein
LVARWAKARWRTLRPAGFCGKEVGWIGEQKRESRPAGEKKRGEKGSAQEKENGFPFYTYRILRGISKRDFHKSLREIQMKFKMS